MSVPPSGEQFEISSGEHRATIVEVGGGIRRYEVGGRPVLDPFPLEEMCDGAHGAPLIPWPNRLADGRYSFDGEEFQVSLTEPEKNNAIHGFFLWRPWIRTEHEADRLVMSARLHPLAGYPFQLDLNIAYELSGSGLKVTTTAVNTGSRACPYGHGQHPYLSPGGGLIDDCSLRIPGRTRITTDPVRQLPTGPEPVAGTEFDFVEPAALGPTAIDFAFTDLERDADGLAWTRLGAPDGTSAEIWVDRSFPFVEIYTGDTLTPERARRGLGTEPMTCAPDGFNSGDGLLRLEPGDSATTTWGALLR
ncbi:MAG TPA: aldose 1-epimerase family protein [Solirubrobacterales bacterium]|nr:aldose 1-epimerase family protein [Solirubrobacterales bacterium]